MKKATAEVWTYQNSKARGRTWAAELRVGNALVCAFGQKTMRAAIAAADKAAKALGWRHDKPWRLVAATSGEVKRLNGTARKWR